MATAALSYSESEFGKSKTTDDQFTLAETASTAYTIQSGVSTSGRTENYLPLSRLSRHSIKIKASSSFPNILSLYQDPIREETFIDRKPVVRPEKKVKKPKVKEKTEKSSNWDDIQATKVRSERFLSKVRTFRVEQVARAQLDKFDEYQRSLQEKVEAQRLNRKRYNEVLQERLKAIEQQEIQSRRIKRGPKHVYVHDKKYLKNLPESRYCKVVRLSDDLQRKGVIKTKHEIEKFWSEFGKKSVDGTSIFAGADPISTVPDPRDWVSQRAPGLKSEPSGIDSFTVKSKKKRRKHKAPRSEATDGTITTI